VDTAARRRAWQQQARDDLEDARAAVGASDPADRLRLAFELLAVTVAELARRSATDVELARRLEGEPPVDLSARWRAR